MAKKRGGTAKAKKEVKPRKKGRAAFVLCSIAVFLLFFNGIVAVLLKDMLSDILKNGYNIIKSPISILTDGVIWVVLAALVWVTMYRTEKLDIKSEKWLLLSLGVISILSEFISGVGTFAFIAGILVLAASIIYLRRK